MLKVICGGFAALAVSVGLAGPAHADKQEFLDFIHSRGVPSEYFATPGADYSNVKVAEMICDVFGNGGTVADIPFLGFQQNGHRDTLIEGAQRFICPDASN